MGEAAAPLGIVSSVPDMAEEPRTTTLDALRADLARPTDEEIVTLVVPGRPGYAIRYAAKITYDRYAAWIKRSEDKTAPAGINALRLNAIVLANCARSIRREGEDILADDGSPLTFTSKALWEALEGAVDAVSAVKAFYDNDAHVIRSGQEVLAAAGYSDTIDEAEPDPTQP